MDVAAEDKSWALFENGIRQFSRTKMFRIRLKRAVDIASGDTWRRMGDKHVQIGGYFREPVHKRVVLALECPRIGDDWYPGGAIECHAVDFRSTVAEIADIGREVEVPVDSLIFEDEVSYREEIMVARDDDKLNLRVGGRPFPKPPVALCL